MINDDDQTKILLTNFALGKRQCEWCDSKLFDEDDLENYDLDNGNNMSNASLYCQRNDYDIVFVTMVTRGCAHYEDSELVIASSADL